MKGNIQITSKFCKTCNKQMKFERNSMIWGLGDLFMIIVAAIIGANAESGLILILAIGGWIAFRFGSNAVTNPWRCKECGEEYEK
jgi:hypothetical protein